MLATRVCAFNSCHNLFMRRFQLLVSRVGTNALHVYNFYFILEISTV